jgi:dephospho-CoA kinase
MKVLGLTGGIGMGKSACATLIAARGIPVIDTDELARQVVEPGQPALAEIQRLFGADLIDGEGRLRRDRLAQHVFANSEARRQLEALLHPRIRALWRAQVSTWKTEGKPLCFVVIPLLYETNAQAELDAVVCVACSAPTQRQRLLARGWSAEQLEARLQAQWPVDKKLAASNYVIWTEGGMDLHDAQLERILNLL